ncbi:hypothetical protein GYN07_25540 (plasmid) [Rhizobium leguminosarum bv. viciae 248]|uniref:hypothetical protein n=1 Tax=Rhizobium leguminosarum TaxID=384 RepID=UPI0012BD0BB6|nr:hypothetical protein [Rhizobium leguminosarum]MCA2406285.1 hypothetical protein [Rhizobium leguminosarum]NKM59749.1 hypothetical protein [Rhizobium leguminosarum bv. viciae]QHW27700.1 hypothetical protein GYN07_25540 [Rhizobium leguminosarum bv. viciae 248]
MAKWLTPHQVMADVKALADCIDGAAPSGSLNAIQLNGGSGGFLGGGPLANGQLLIESSGNPPQVALTAGPGITIANTTGGITLSSAGAPGGNPARSSSTAPAASAACNSPTG